MINSPLRYPGGKSKLYGLVNSIISQYADMVDTYVEPFAGGADIALHLLENKRVKKIIINDINIGVYSFWDSICNRTDDFLKLLNDTEINIDNYQSQKQIYEYEKKDAANAAKYLKKAHKLTGDDKLLARIERLEKEADKEENDE